MDAPERDPLADFEIRRQPDDTTCGPTCLHAVYRHFGDDIPFEQLLDEIPALEEGGTHGVHLATHALSRGYRARIVTWNLQVFDPTWFARPLPVLRERLLARAEGLTDAKAAVVCRAFVNFLDAGGEVELGDLDAALLRRFLRKGLPILTGLSATFLYREEREEPSSGVTDDVLGEPVGHFVVLTGYAQSTREVLVNDPLHPNPLAEHHTYQVPMNRLVGAIYLGVLTHDANLIILEPPKPPNTDADHRRHT
jgi:hypothetical protein